MIFILGGRGLVGSAFVRECQRRGEPFEVIDRANYSAHAGSHCDLFVNANGNSSKVWAKTDPLKDFDASVRSVRSSLIDFSFDRYVHLSSCDVYPDCSSPDLTREEQALDLQRQSPYGFHKYASENCVRHAAKEWLIFRFGGFVGPGLKKNAIFDILKGGPLWLHPESSLQFLSTDEAARIVLDIAGTGVARETFNLCGRGLVRLQELVDIVQFSVSVQEGSPRVLYDVSIEKISRLVSIPLTRTAVVDFVRSELEQRSRANIEHAAG